MRLEILFEPKANEYILPVNYLYPLSAVVYKIFAAGSESIAKWLHEKGFTDNTGKNLKLFNFSKLVFEKYSINTEFIKCRGNCSFIFSTPVETKLAETFISGIFNLQSFQIGNSRYQSEFVIKGIEIRKPPEFSDEHVFKLITPVSVSTMIEINNKKQIYYFRPEDKSFTEAIRKNLIKKYEMLYRKQYTGNLELALPVGVGYKSKLIHIKEGTPDETRIKGFLTTISIKGEPEIMEVAYYCGIGERNSLGFGMVEIELIERRLTISK